MIYKHYRKDYTITKGVISMCQIPYEPGTRIREMRKKRGYTREKLAEYADISVQFLADIERGQKSMTLKTLRNIAAALNITTDYIVNGSEPFTENAELNLMLASLSPYKRRQAEKLLAVFIETLNNPENDK